MVYFALYTEERRREVDGISYPDEASLTRPLAVTKLKPRLPLKHRVDNVPVKPHIQCSTQNRHCIQDDTSYD
jgi:hypothetical protein